MNGFLILGIIALTSITVDASVNEKVYSYEQLIEIYENNSVDLKVIEIQQEINKYELMRAEEQLRDQLSEYRRNKGRSQANPDNNDMRTDYYNSVEAFGKAQIDESQQRGKIKYQDAIVYEAKQKKIYGFQSLLVQYIILAEQRKLVIDTIDFYTQIRDIEVAKEEIGLGVGLDIITAESDINVMINQLDILNNSIDMLNDMITIELDLEAKLKIVIGDKPIYTHTQSFVLEEGIENYLGKSSNLALKDLDYKAYEENVKILKAELPEKNKKLEEAKWQMHKAEIDVEDGKSEGRNHVIDTFGEYQKAKEEYAIASEAYQSQNRLLEDAKEGLSQGQVSALELEGIRLKVMETKTTKFMAEMQYYLASLKLDLVFQGLNLE